MEELLGISEHKLSGVSLNFKRYLFYKIKWDNRLIGIKGSRGIGKTTMLLQWLKQLQLSTGEGAYFSLDELYFTRHTLVDTAKAFYDYGGKVLILDEVHKYPGWSVEIKNLYDRYDDLKIIFTGSSIIDISKQEGDLSRRALMYELKGLSFREFLNFKYSFSLDPFTLEQILFNDLNLKQIFPVEFKPYSYFKEYLQFGYYPFYAFDGESYHQRLRQLTRTIIEYDMAEMKGFDIRHAKKMLQLLYVVAQEVPFKPNINSLATKTGIHRNSVNNYLYFLQEARLLSLVSSSSYGIAMLQKPEKLFLENTNLLYAIFEGQPSIGTVREIFFYNQLSEGYRIAHDSNADFKVNNQYTFEIGGKTKKQKQIESLPDAWLVKDDIELKIGKSIPLYLFGFLY